MSLRKILGGVFASTISKNRYRIYISEPVAERIARGMEEIQRAQDKFARAMTQYSEQLKSHTSAIEGLSKASHELTMSAAEQNKFLTRLTALIEQPPAVGEDIIPEQEEESELRNIAYPPGCYKRRPQQNKDEQLIGVR